MLTKPELTVAESGIIKVTLSELDPSSENVVLLATEPSSVIHDCQPRFP